MKWGKISWLVVAFVLGCSGPVMVSPDAGPDSVCDPGRSVACTGPGGCAGGQTCDSDGSGYGPCECGMVPMDDAGSPVDDAGMVEPDDAGMPRADAGTPETDAGADCTCPDDGNDCTRDQCVDGVCVHDAAAKEDAECGFGLGTCHSGGCCTGCWDGSSCLGGEELSACGSEGASCASCTAPACQVPVCGVRGCSTSPEPNGTACDGGAGVCFGGACAACGGLNEQCCTDSTCGSGLSCQGSGVGRCQPCGGAGEECCPNTTGAPALCDSGSLVCNRGTCETCGGFDEPACVTGPRCEPGLDPTIRGGTVVCRCGDPGLTCCSGGVCADGSFCSGGVCP